MSPTRRSVLGTAAVVTLAGCAQSSDGGTSPADTPSPTASLTRSPTSTRSPTDSPTSTRSPTDSPTSTPASAQEQFPDYSWDTFDGVDPVGDASIRMSGFDTDGQNG